MFLQKTKHIQDRHDFYVSIVLRITGAIHDDNNGIRCLGDVSRYARSRIIGPRSVLHLAIIALCYLDSSEGNGITLVFEHLGKIQKDIEYLAVDHHMAPEDELKEMFREVVLAYMMVIPLYDSGL